MLRQLPTLNAALNALSAGLLALGYLRIRQGRKEQHRKLMLSALACSTAFLLSYLVYHFQVGSVRFARDGALRSVYLGILLSHTLLAALIVPLVAVTVFLALTRRYDSHRRWARVTLPLWTYVSVTGVVIYWMLYRL